MPSSPKCWEVRHRHACMRILFIDPYGIIDARQAGWRTISNVGSCSFVPLLAACRLLRNPATWGQSGEMLLQKHDVVHPTRMHARVRSRGSLPHTGRDHPVAIAAGKDEIRDNEGVILAVVQWFPCVVHGVLVHLSTSPLMQLAHRTPRHIGMVAAPRPLRFVRVEASLDSTRSAAQRRRGNFLAARLLPRCAQALPGRLNRWLPLGTACSQTARCFLQRQASRAPWEFRL